MSLLGQILCLLFVTNAVVSVHGCTTFVLGKKATVDGSTMATHSNVSVPNVSTYRWRVLVYRDPMLYYVFFCIFYITCPMCM